MAEGKVKFFDMQRGFGFIQPDDGSKDMFVHISAVEKAGLVGLRPDQRVSYEAMEERGKISAVNLKSSDAPSEQES